MTRTLLIQMLQEAGVLSPLHGATENQWRAFDRFAALIASAERDAIIRLLDEMRHTDRDGVIAAIRARGNQ